MHVCITAILNNLDSLIWSHPVVLLAKVASIAEESMGGTSGALYCLFFTSGAKELALLERETTDWRRIWYRAFLSGLNCLEKYGKAKVGDRTMVRTFSKGFAVYVLILTEEKNEQELQGEYHVTIVFRSMRCARHVQCTRNH